MAGAERKPVVLVVDDDEQSRKLMQLVLKIEGYQVETADCGQHALERIGSEVPDAVVLDFFMPGMDGPELCARIRALPLPRKLPLIVLSGYDDSKARRDALDAGADDYVLKPLNRVALRDRLASLIAS